MSHAFRSTALLALALFCAGRGEGNPVVPPGWSAPQPAVSQQAPVRPSLGQLPLRVAGVKGIRNAELHIPRKFLIDAGILPPGAKDLRPGALGPSAFRTVVAGAALALALSCAGFLMVRRGRRAAMGMLVLLLGATTIAGVSCLSPEPSRGPVAELAPLAPLRSTAPGRLEGEAHVELDDGEAILLSLDAATLAKLTAEANRP
jgi:hypothetical protein